MSDALVLAPTASPTVFLAPDGSKHTAPTGWACLPPGDAGLTRRVKSLGPSLAIIEKRGHPVGSGTVARTERIPVERRAESAVIAWMRHQTTAYDSMSIPRIAAPPAIRALTTSHASPTSRSPANQSPALTSSSSPSLAPACPTASSFPTAAA